MTIASLANSGIAAKTNTVANGLDPQNIRTAVKPKEQVSGLPSDVSCMVNHVA